MPIQQASSAPPRGAAEARETGRTRRAEGGGRVRRAPRPSPDPLPTSKCATRANQESSPKGRASFEASLPRGKFASWRGARGGRAAGRSHLAQGRRGQWRILTPPRPSPPRTPRRGRAGRRLSLAIRGALHPRRLAGILIARQIRRSRALRQLQRRPRHHPTA